MDCQFLTHDAAWAMARDIVEVFAGCLREEERHEAFVEVLTRAKAGLEQFQERKNRMQQRLRPGAN